MKRRKYSLRMGSFSLLIILLFLEILHVDWTTVDFIGISGGQQPPVLQPGSLQHEFFPIILHGSDVPQLIGLWDHNIRVTYYADGWHLESFQIDERDFQQSDLATQGGFVATDPQHPHYTKDTSDSTQYFGFDDELVFYARQGAKVSEANWWNTTYPNQIELEIQEPNGIGNGTAWMYIYYDTQDHGRWLDDPAYHDYVRWSGKKSNWYTEETDWYLSSKQDSNPGLKDLLQIAPSGNDPGVNLLEEGVKTFTKAFLDLPGLVGDIRAHVREGHWNDTYYDDIVDNVGYGGSPIRQNSADGVPCIDGPVRVIYFMRHYYSYTMLGLPTVVLEFNTWVAVYLIGSFNGPLFATNQITPLRYIDQITTASFADVNGMKFVDEAGRLGIIDGNPLNDDFRSNFNSPSHWGFYYGPHGSIWIAMPYDSFVAHGCEVGLYWADFGKWHRGAAGQFTRITPGNSTWWTTPIWSFIGQTILSDSLARVKAAEYLVIYENWLQTGNFFRLARNLHLLEFTNRHDTFSAPPLSHIKKIPIWAPLIVLVFLTGLGLLWRRIRSSTTPFP